MVLRYLRTGDNGGYPELDQKLASQVGHLTLPQARGVADNVVQACDQNVDRQEAAAQRAELAREQQAQRQAEQAQRRIELTNREISQCQGIGGRHADEERCYSTVKGNPSGEPGASCTFQDGTPIWTHSTTPAT